MDLLGRVLATDRADTPAVTHRRHLAERQPTPPPGPRRRAGEPDWVGQWQNDVRERVPMIDRLLATMANERPGLEHAVTETRAAFDKARAIPAPDQHDVFQARRQANLDAADAKVARYRASVATWRTRRTLERAASDASNRAAISAQHADQLESAYRPAAERREAARVAHAKAEMRLEAHDRRVTELRGYRADDIALDQAISVWRTWAAGRTITVADLGRAAGELARHADTVPEARALLTAVVPEHPALHPSKRRRVVRGGVDFGIDL